MPLIANESKWYEDIIPLTDGIVTWWPPEISPKGSSAKLEGWYELRRELRKSPGKLRRSDLDSAVRGIHYYWGPSNAEDFLLIHTLSNVFKTRDLVAYQNIYGFVDPPIPTKRDAVSYATITIPTARRVLWTDGVRPPVEHDPATGVNVNMTLPTGVTQAKIVRFFKARTLLIDVVESGVRQGQRIWHSVPFTYNNWSTIDGAGTDEYAEGGGHVVQALEFNDAMVLFKEHRIGAIQATGDELFPFRVQDFPEVPGTIFPNSPVVTPRGILYLAYDGVRLFDGQRSILISGQAGFDVAAVAADQRDAVVGHWDLRLQRYLLAQPKPGSSDNDTLWEFHFATNEAQLLNQGQLYKRRQTIARTGEFLRRSPLRCRDLPVLCKRVPFTCTDPEMSGAFPAFISGDYTGGFFEQEMLTDDDGRPLTAVVELGPYPKDPMVTNHLGKAVTDIKFRGRFTKNSLMTVEVRPTHTQEWVPLPEVVEFNTDRYSVTISGDGIEGEQFFVRLTDSGQFSWTRVYSLVIFGTHSGAAWRDV